MYAKTRAAHSMPRKSFGMFGFAGNEVMKNKMIVKKDEKKNVMIMNAFAYKKLPGGE